MLLKIALGLIALLAVFLLIAAFQPNQFRVERSTTINASPDVVFAQINDVPNYVAWNPWVKLDPELKGTYSGPRSGVGAAYAWTSQKVGEGQSTIVESRPNELVRLRLDFLKPFKSTSTADFALASSGGKTTVTWHMYGEKNYISKVMGLVMNMDRMIGGEFEKGLADLKAISESATIARR
jgi:hypothetical protein